MQIVTIIPTLNRPNFLRKSLQSICNQSVRPHKVIILNNNKNTNINKKVYDEFKKNLNLSYLSNFEPIEFLRNSVAIDLDYDLISFLDDDDQWHSNYISKSLELFKEKQIDALYTSCDLININDKKISELNLKNEYKIQEVLVYNPGFLTSNVIIKKNVFKKLNGFNSKFGSADKDLYIRLKEKNYIVYINTERLVLRTIHSDQLSKDYKIIFLDKLKFFVKNFHKLDLRNKFMYIRFLLVMFCKFLIKLFFKK